MLSLLCVGYKTIGQWLAEEVPRTELLIVNSYSWHRAVLMKYERIIIFFHVGQTTVA